MYFSGYTATWPCYVWVSIPASCSRDVSACTWAAASCSGISPSCPRSRCSGSGLPCLDAQTGTPGRNHTCKREMKSSLGYTSKSIHMKLRWSQARAILVKAYIWSWDKLNLGYTSWPGVMLLHDKLYDGFNKVYLCNWPVETNKNKFRDRKDTLVFLQTYFIWQNIP